MAPRRSAGKAPEVLSAAYLERAGGKSELLRRLENVTESLDQLPDDCDPASHPGLLSLAAALVSPPILEHKDKDVRLRAVLAACELFYLYAPEPPWEAGEILAIFRQLIRQLGNLHATSPESAHFESYFRILEQLSEVKIGVVLVDLVRTERGGGDGEEGESALETLCELVRTLLHCAHVDHPPEVAAHAELAVAACIEEFEGNIPVPILEEILTCVGGGPVVWVPNPAFATVKNKKGGKTKGKDDEAPPQIQQTNTSYLLAAKVLRRTEDKVSSPLASLLNGLLTGDPRVLETTTLSTVDADAAALLSPKTKKKKTKKGGADSGTSDDSPSLAAHLASKDNAGANVYAVAYELHRIAPQILTTVIGTVSHELRNEDVARRWQATRLLGRLFGARGSDIAARFGPCFREWLKRSYDPEAKVRETMVKCLTNFLAAHPRETDLCADATEALAAVISTEATVDVRLLGIRQVCDLAHGASVAGPPGSAADDTDGGKRKPPIAVVSAELLRAVGNRVSSKNKTERKDAVTGLAQVYYKHHLKPAVRDVQAGGDDADIDTILDALRAAQSSGGENSAHEEKFAWIPRRVFECACFSDAVDPEMRSRIFQLVDDVLLGTAKGGGNALTPTARAVGLAMIVAGVREKDNAYRWMQSLFVQRARLQRALGGYLDARAKARECPAGSPAAFAAESEATEKLEAVAALTAPVEGNGRSSPDKADAAAVLGKVHKAKDKHIFRILSTICDPAHSPAARARALDELPKRTKGLGAPAQSWVKNLARRCAMGAFLNAENVEHCVLLARESFEAGDCPAAAAFLECVRLAASIFPPLVGAGESFQNLVEFFDAARTTSMTAGMRREMEKCGVVTTLSEVLARGGAGAALARPSSGNKKTADDDDDDGMDFDDDGTSSYDTLRAQLLRLCTRDGTPEQARNGVLAISSLIGPAANLPGGTKARAQKERREFEPLLKALANPARLALPDDDAAPKARGRIVSVLSAIAAIAECAPYAFNAPREGNRTGWGHKAVDFCLDTALLGKHARRNASQMDDDDDSDLEDSPPAKKGRRSNGHGVSIHCQMLCGAVEVLVGHIRATIRIGRQTALAKSKDDLPALAPPSAEHIAEVFATLAQIIEDGGVPPSSVDGRHCRTARDMAELRRSASVHLLRLCDASLKLEETHLTPRMWHVLSLALLDEDKSVRGAFVDELSCLYTGAGAFRAVGLPQLAPSLRFVALVTLCADGDHGAHSAANGLPAGFANVGHKKTHAAKAAATRCTKELRTVCQSAAAQCRSLGRAAEANFEARLKRKLMPEYVVPYAMHLLAFRGETASAAGTLAGEADDAASDVASEGDEEAGASGEVLHGQEASQKMLRKRLKWLFDPLVQSLGASADNISFLLRMVETVGKHPPINVLAADADLDLDEDAEAFAGITVSENEAEARMKIVAQFAREALLAHVKKDVNLTAYPGRICVPGDLYGARRSVSPKPVYESDDSDDAPKRKKPKQSISHYVKKRESEEKMKDDEVADSSPASVISPAASSEKDEDLDMDFGDTLSPIAKTNDSPALAHSSRKKRATSGSSKRTKSKASSGKKRRADSIDVFDDFASPEGSGGKRAKSAKRSKATPVSVPKEVRLPKDVTNDSAGSGAASSQKKRSSKKKAASAKKDESFDFSDSPVKPKSNSNGRRKKSASKAPAKAKISIGGVTKKAKVAVGKATSSSRRKKSSPVETSPMVSEPSTSSRRASSSRRRRPMV
ncbi:hypothetical protein ACHAXT_007204 [Thalassiosira profunda]